MPRTSWKDVKPRHVTEIIYSLVKLKEYENIEMYSDLFEHIRPHINKLNNQDISMLVWSLSKIQFFNIRAGNSIILATESFSVKSMLKILLERAEKKIFKMDGTTASMLYNSLHQQPSYMNLSLKLKSQMESLSKEETK